jgi:hypothetical protein
LSLSLEEGRRPAEIREQLSLWRQCRATGTPPAADPSDLSPLLRPILTDVEQHVTH